MRFGAVKVTLGILVSISALAQQGTPLGAVESAMDGNLAQFERFFSGEFNNNEQVWQQKEEAQRTATGIPENPFDHLHMVIRKIDAPELGSLVFLAKQYAPNEPTKALRQRIYSASVDSKSGAIKLMSMMIASAARSTELWAKPEQAKALTAKDVKPLIGCDISLLWQAKLQAFEGQSASSTCKVELKGARKAFQNERWRITENMLAVTEQTLDGNGKRVAGRADLVPIMARRVRYFTGWAYINNAGRNATNLDTKFHFQKGIEIHNEGQRVELLMHDGKSSGYLIELAQLTYQETKTPILKLALIDKVDGKSATYIWSDTGATRIGMNLKWLQVGLTQKDDSTIQSVSDTKR